MRHLICQIPLHNLNSELRKSQLFITPNRHAARALDVPHYPLQNLAVEILANQNISLKPVSPVRAYQLLREVIREIINPQDLEGTTRVWMPTIQALLKACSTLPKSLNLSDRADKLIQVAIAYQQLLHKQNWIDPSEVFWRAIEILSTNPQQKSLLIYGYFSPSWDEVNFINAIAGKESLFYLPITEHDLFNTQRQIITFVENQGWQSIPAQKTETITVGAWLGQQFLATKPKTNPQKLAIQSQIYPDQPTEARGILAQIKEQLHKGVSSQDIVIVAANDTDWGPLLLDIAWEFGIALRLPYTIPLRETRLGAWLERLLEVIEQQFPYELTTQLLRHPLSPKLKGELWQKIRQIRPNNFTQWQSILGATTALEINYLQLPLDAPRDRWFILLKEIFKAFNLRQNAAAHWAKESVAYQTLEKGLEDLAQPKDDLLTWPMFRDEILTSLKILKTVAYPGREGIELHTPQSIMGAKYAQVFVLDMLESKLPQAIADDPVLDFYERQQLKVQGILLPQAAELAQRESLNFYYLLQTATEKITFSYARLDHQGSSYRSGEPSSYFSRLGLIPTDPPVIPLSSPEMARQIYLRQPATLEDQVLTHAIAAFEVEKYRESALPANEYDGVVGVSFDYSEHWFSVSQLTQLGQCPFKWFASKLLNLAEPDEIEDDLSPSLRGNLYHKVLELALNAAQTDSQVDITSKENLHQWFLQAEKLLKFPDLPAWPSRRVEQIKILQRAMQQPEFLPENGEVLALESKFEGEWQGLKVRGQVDRIDRTPDGLILIDYKTSSAAPKGIKDATGEAKLDLQLPLYQAVAASALYPQETVYKTSYYSLTQGKDISPKSTSTETELMEAAERLKSHLHHGNYPVQPDLKQHACEYCSYDPVCRKGDRLQRKENFHE